MLNQVIDVIYVYDKEEVNGEINQNVEIHYKFIGKNVLDKFEDKLKDTIEKLEVEKIQLENTKIEEKKPFEKTDVLKDKTFRLTEINF